MQPKCPFQTLCSCTPCVGLTLDPYRARSPALIDVRQHGRLKAAWRDSVVHHIPPKYTARSPRARSTRTKAMRISKASSRLASPGLRLPACCCRACVQSRSHRSATRIAAFAICRTLPIVRWEPARASSVHPSPFSRSVRTHRRRAVLTFHGTAGRRDRSAGAAALQPRRIESLWLCAAQRYGEIKRPVQRGIRVQ